MEWLWPKIGARSAGWPGPFSATRARAASSQWGAKGTDPGFLVRGTVIKYLKDKLAHYLDPATSIESLEASW